MQPSSVYAVLCALVCIYGQSKGAQDAAPHQMAKRRDLDPQTCVDNFDVHRDKIIRTEDSREMGAKYLNEVDLGSRDECLRLCCETDTCDVFVFEEKNPGSCYLFHCGPPEDFKCKFTRHTNFSSAVLAVSRHLAELEDQIKLTKHEQDLASLRKQYPEVLTTTKTTTVHPSNLNRETAPPVLARRCSRFQFECHSSEECIAIYNACDGIPQCADGSDEAPELGCPATTTLPPLPPLVPNLPSRELPPRLPQMAGYGPGVPETIPMQKDIVPQHSSPFMSPNPSQDGSPWPRRLEQIPQSSSSHIKQYGDNAGGSHIFNHKGGLQVTETDSGAPIQYDYKPLSYDSIPENNWQHRGWQQPQSDPSNINDGLPMYHIDTDIQNSWKQQIMQNNQIQHRVQNNQNQLNTQRIQLDKINVQSVPNMFQDRDKIWVVPQMPNIQENQQSYTQTKIMPLSNESYDKNQFQVEKSAQQPLSKVTGESEDEQELQDEVTAKSKDDKDDSDKSEKHIENKNNKKHNANKSKKKHTKDESEENKKEGIKKKDKLVSERIIMDKLEDDIHDGIAERPPGAILLLTLGICMTSIMVVLLGCRIKMARRRMRRMGKSPFAHDADYLVNGMYL